MKFEKSGPMNETMLIIKEVIKAAKDVVFPETIAAEVMHVLDPEAKSPLLVGFNANLELRQLARFLLRAMHKEEQDTLEIGQLELSDMEEYRLQSRYPAERCLDCGQPSHPEEVGHVYEPSDGYVPLSQCMGEELLLWTARAKREVRAKSKHIQAMELYVERKYPEVWERWKRNHPNGKDTIQ